MRRDFATRVRTGAALGAALALLGMAACGGEAPSLTTCEAADGVDPVCGFQNPEDLALLPGGSWLAVSQMPKRHDTATVSGNVVAWRPTDDRREVLFPPAAGSIATSATAERWGDPGCEGPPMPGEFGPHGIDVIERDSGETALAVVSHGPRDTIELFEFAWTPKGPRVTWRGCIEVPSDVWPNDVALRPNGELVVTKMLSGNLDSSGFLELARLILGLETGYVLAWEPSAGWSEIDGTRGSAPNGIAVTPDGSEVFFAEWRAGRLVRVRRREDGSSEVDAVALPHYPDNVSWTPDGRLLVAGQVGDWAELIGCGQLQEGNCAAGFSVLRVDPSTLRIEVVLDHPGTATGGVSSALVVGDDLYVGTFSGDRVARAPYTP